MFGKQKFVTEKITTMASIFHLTTSAVAREVDYNVFALRQFLRIHGTPYSQRRSPAENSPHRFAIPDILAHLRAKRKRGVSVVDLINNDRAYRSAHGLCGPAVWLGDQKVTRACAILATLTEAERVRLDYIRKDFNHGLASAFWNKVACIDPHVRECLILHPEVYAAVLGDENHNLPRSPAVWGHWASQFVLSNSDAATITALAA